MRIRLFLGAADESEDAEQELVDRLRSLQSSLEHTSAPLRSEGARRWAAAALCHAGLWLRAFLLHGAVVHGEAGQPWCGGASRSRAALRGMLGHDMYVRLPHLSARRRPAGHVALKPSGQPQVVWIRPGCRDQQRAGGLQRLPPQREAALWLLLQPGGVGAGAPAPQQRHSAHVCGQPARGASARQLGGCTGAWGAAAAGLPRGCSQRVATPCRNALRFWAATCCFASAAHSYASSCPPGTCRPQGTSMPISIPLMQRRSSGKDLAGDSGGRGDLFVPPHMLSQQVRGRRAAAGTASALQAPHCRTGPQSGY